MAWPIAATLYPATAGCLYEIPEKRGRSKRQCTTDFFESDTGITEIQSGIF